MVQKKKKEAEIKAPEKEPEDKEPEEEKIEIKGDEIEVLTEEKVKEGEAEEVVVKEKSDVSGWVPKTELGRKVKAREITDLSMILDEGRKLLEPEIVDALLGVQEADLLLIGQSKGKFGGGQRRIFKQTQKKTQEGNKPKFCTCAVVGNKDGFVGIGYGKAKETVPAREKAIRKAKLNIFKIRRGCGSWECSCKEAHSVPFAVIGKAGSVRITIYPAPKGTGLCIEKECGRILKAAGIKDVWSRVQGHTASKMNLINSCVIALKKLMDTKVKPVHYEMLNMQEGPSKKE